MLRLFVTSNQISSVFCSTLAKKTAKKGDTDLLLIDNFLKKESLIELIYESSRIHEWNSIVDFSIKIPDTYNLKPGLWKRFSRRLKHFPGISLLYKFATGIYSKGKTKESSKVIFNKLNGHYAISPGTPVELFLLTQTSLNSPLIEYFNSPVINYYEHGLVDYLYVLEKDNVNAFYVIFYDAYKAFLAKNNITKINARSYFEREDMLTGFPESGKKIDLSCNGRYSRFAIILLDSAEIFNVPSSFWKLYLEKCIGEINDPDQYGIIIKPHPGQSNETLQLIKEFCGARKNIVLLVDPVHISMSVEQIYISYRSQVDYVFSTYSAAEFYLAKFFGGHTKFYFLYEFIKPFYSKGPKQYASAYAEMKTYINEVFVSDACKFLK